MRQNPTHARLLAALATACVVVAMPGCTKHKSSRVRDFLDGVQIDAPLETSASVSLGEFHVPVGARTDDSEQDTADDVPAQASAKKKVVWMEVKFKLSAETAPESVEALTAAAKEKEGPLGDAILTGIRSSSPDELADPRLAAVKSRLTEAVRELFGANMVRQLVLNDVTSEAL